MVGDRIGRGGWIAPAVVAAGVGLLLFAGIAAGAPGEPMAVERGATATAAVGPTQGTASVEVVLNETYNVSGYDSASALVALPGGGYLIGGTVYAPAGDGDAVVLEVGPGGSLESVRRFGGPGEQRLLDLVRTSDGGYAFAGWTGNYTDSEAWIVKVDASGTVAYDRRIGVAGEYRESADGIVATADGGVAVVGSTGLTVPGTGTAPLFYEFDANGDVLASAVYERPVNRTAHDLAATGDGGYVIVGGEGFGYYGTDDPPKAWLYRVDPTGSRSWSRTLRNGSAHAVARLSNGDYAVSGYGLAILDAGRSGWLRRVDAGGATLWERSVGGAAVAPTADGGYVLAYGTGGGMIFAPEYINGVVAKRGVDGHEQWNRTLGVANTSGFADVAAVDAGRYAAAGATNGSFWLVELVESNAPPRAYAGPDHVADEGTGVELDGRQSTDPDGDALRYEWTQVAGPAVDLEDATTATPAFDAPRVDADAELSFELTVTDDRGASDTARVNVTVREAAVVTRIAFEYEDFGGNVNLEVNGDRRHPDDFADLDGATVGGTAVSVPRPATDTSGEGVVVIAGTITSFSVGGQEFLVDNVTFGPRDATLADVEFDALTPSQSGYDVGDEFTADRPNVSMRVDEFVFADGEVYAGGSGSSSDGPDPVFWPTNVNLRFNLSSVVAGATPVVEPGSVRISPYPVAVGEQPTVTANVSRASGVTLRVAVTDPGFTTAVPMRNVAGDRWEADLATVDVLADLDPGTAVDLAIVAENDAGRTVVDRYRGEMPRFVATDTDLDYTAFREVREVGVVVGDLPGESVPERFQSLGTIRAWERARELDVNNYYGSGNGSMGAVGFDLSYHDYGGEFHRLPRERSAYFRLTDTGFLKRSTVECPFVGETCGAIVLLDDLKAAAGFDPAPYDLWIGTHPGESVGKARFSGLHQSSGGGRSERIYAPMGEGIELWLHELGHATPMGFDDVTTAVGAGTALMAHGTGADATTPITSVHRIGLDTTGGAGVDWLSPDRTTWSAGGDAREASFTASALRSYALGDSVPVLEVDTDGLLGSGIGAGSVSYVIEARPALEPPYALDRSAAVVYRVEGGTVNRVASTGTAGELIAGGDSLRDRPGLGSGASVAFELASEGGSGDAYTATVEARLVPPAANTKTVALEDRTRVPDRAVATAGVTSPDLDLVVVDARGRRVGVVNGTFVDEIPGATGSGDRAGLEWVTVPADADVRARVSSTDVARFVNATGVDRGNVTVAYRTAVTRAGGNPRIEPRDGGYTVTGAATRVTGTREMAVGATRSAFDAGVVAAVEVAPRQPTPGEQVTLDGSLSVGLNSSIASYEWSVGNRTVATGPTLTRTFDATGDRQFRLAVTGVDGATDATTATVTVVPPVPDLTGNGQRATDPDGDGRYEDVTGDGSFDVRDVAALLAHFEDQSVVADPEPFDFSGDGRVNVIDVAELLAET